VCEVHRRHLVLLGLSSEGALLKGALSRSLLDPVAVPLFGIVIVTLLCGHCMTVRGMGNSVVHLIVEREVLSEIIIVLWVMIQKAVDTCHGPLLFTELLAHRGIHILDERSLQSDRLGICVVGADPPVIYLL